MALKKYTLLELNSYLKRVIALNIMHKVWVSGEITEISESRGHHYLDIVQKDEETGQILAKSSAIIWQSAYQNLYRKIGFQIHSLLKPGIKVLMEVKVDYHERFGLKLSIQDIDPIYTVGQLEADRLKTLNELKRLGLVNKNKQTDLSLVPQRIAVISSKTAAGLEDFLEQLKGNPYGFRFECTLLTAAMQGENTSKDVTKRLREITIKQEDFDAVVIIRGGGAKLDLLAFDDLEICKLAANCPLPLLTGIGHERDDTILDQVAYQAHKTPTAVADFLIERALRFSEHLGTLASRLNISIQQQLSFQQLTFQQLKQRLKFGTEQRLTNQGMLLNYLKDQIPKTVGNRLSSEQQQLRLVTKQLKLLSPEFALSRGFSITTKDGLPVKDIDALKPGDEITTQLPNGTIQSIVK